MSQLRTFQKPSPGQHQWRKSANRHSHHALSAARPPYQMYRMWIHRQTWRRSAVLYIPEQKRLYGPRLQLLSLKKDIVILALSSKESYVGRPILRMNHGLRTAKKNFSCLKLVSYKKKRQLWAGYSVQRKKKSQTFPLKICNNIRHHILIKWLPSLDQGDIQSLINIVKLWKKSCEPTAMESDW